MPKNERFCGVGLSVVFFENVLLLCKKTVFGYCKQIKERAVENGAGCGQINDREIRIKEQNQQHDPCAAQRADNAVDDACVGIQRTGCQVGYKCGGGRIDHAHGNGTNEHADKECRQAVLLQKQHRKRQYGGAEKATRQNKRCPSAAFCGASVGKTTPYG